MSEEYPYIDSIAYWIRWSQELILVLSVPLLTIGLVVGTFDFLSGGTLLHYTAIKYGWTALQALVLDACFAMYWVKAFMAKGWGVRIASGLLGLLLGLVAGGINFLQQVSELLHITALDSLLHLGFPPEFLLLLRALLSVILLAIGACSVARKERVTKNKETSTTKPETPEEAEETPPVSQEALEETPTLTLQEIMAQILQVIMPENSVESVTNEPLKQTENFGTYDQLAMYHPGETLEQYTFSEASYQPEKPNETPGSPVVVPLLDGGVKREKVKAVLRENPNASLSEIEEKSGASRGYASKIRDELLEEIHQEIPRLNGVH